MPGSSLAGCLAVALTRYFKVFEQRAIHSRLCLRIETRQRKTGKIFYPIPRMWGLDNFWPVTRVETLGLSTWISTFCCISSQWGERIYAELTKPRWSPAVCCLALIVKIYLFSGKARLGWGSVYGLKLSCEKETSIVTDPANSATS